MVAYLNKDKIFEIASNMKFFDKNLEEIISPIEYSKGEGLISWMRAEEDYRYESMIVGKFRIIREVVKKNGDSAIDAYERFTSKPDKSHPLYKDLKFIHTVTGVNLDECLIPIKKEEFELYLAVYNELFK